MRSKVHTRFPLITRKRTIEIIPLFLLPTQGYARKVFVPYAPAYGESFKRGTVTKIDAAGKKVVLENGDEITYDYLVIATGSTAPFPAKFDWTSTKEVADGIKMYNDIKEKVSPRFFLYIILPMM